MCTFPIIVDFLFDTMCSTTEHLVVGVGGEQLVLGVVGDIIRKELFVGVHQLCFFRPSCLLSYSAWCYMQLCSTVSSHSSCLHS